MLFSWLPSSSVPTDTSNQCSLDLLQNGDFSVVNSWIWHSLSICCIRLIPSYNFKRAATWARSESLSSEADSLSRYEIRPYPLTSKNWYFLLRFSHDLGSYFLSKTQPHIDIRHELTLIFTFLWSLAWHPHTVLVFCFLCFGHAFVCVCARMHTHIQLLCRVRLCDPMDCSPPGSSVHGIFQARILEWVAISSSKGSLQPNSPFIIHLLY